MEIDGRAASPAVAGTQGVGGDRRAVGHGLAALHGRRPSRPVVGGWCRWRSTSWNRASCRR